MAGSGERDAAARAAGWRRADLWWECFQTRAKAAQLAGDLDSAAAYWILAYRLGWLILARDDPRFACALANAAAAARHRGRTRVAERRRQRARSLWREVPAWVERVRPAPRARSSLFHLRMASRHHETYAENLRARLRGQVEEARASLEAAILETPGAQCRWVRERPPVFDDTRKLASACFLMAYAAPQARRGVSTSAAGDR